MSETMTGTFLKAIPPNSTLSSMEKRTAAVAVPTPEAVELPVWKSPSSSASMGLMVENIAKLSAHSQSPGKDPKTRVETIKAAGKLRIPFTTGILLGVGENFDDIVQSMLKIRELHQRYGHIQEVIIQPFDPKPGTTMQSCPRPSEVALLNTVALARSIIPEMNIQVPPNLLSQRGAILQPRGSGFERAVAGAILAGANDFGGISSVTPDFINVERLWPSVAQLRSAIKHSGFKPRERLPIYPSFIKEEMFMSKEVRERVEHFADEKGYRAETN